MAAGELCIPLLHDSGARGLLPRTSPQLPPSELSMWPTENRLGTEAGSTSICLWDDHCEDHDKPVNCVLKVTEDSDEGATVHL